MNKSTNMAKLVKKAIACSPWISHLNTGSCNGCDIEIVAALSPRYDVERFGILLKGSPRHADVLICTGAVTRAMAPRLRKIYHQMSDPKFIIAVGGCAIDGGVFRNCYNVIGGVDKVIPVDLYIPGCPPRPEAIIFGVHTLLQSLSNIPKNYEEGDFEKKTPTKTTKQEVIFDV